MDALGAARYQQVLNAQPQSRQSQLHLIGAQAQRLIDPVTWGQAIGRGTPSDNSRLITTVTPPLAQK